MDAVSPHDRALSRRHGCRGWHRDCEVLARADPWRDRDLDLRIASDRRDVATRTPDAYLYRLPVVLCGHQSASRGPMGNHHLYRLLWRRDADDGRRLERQFPDDKNCLRLGPVRH